MSRFWKINPNGKRCVFPAMYEIIGTASRQLIMELLEMDQSGIHVAEYLTQLPLPFL